MPRFRLRTLMIAVGLGRRTSIASARPPAHASDAIEFWPFKIPVSWFTETRLLLVLVVIVGVLLGAGVEGAKMFRRAETYDAIAAKHDGAAAYYRIGWLTGYIEPLPWDKAEEDRPATDPAAVGKWKRLSAYHLRLSRKYKSAASRPWLPVEPDPPPPK